VTITTRPTVVVVGAGISGLAAAWDLVSRRPDLHVVVLDGAPQVGGKLALVEVGGLAVDAGAEALLARRPEGVDLAREVGLGDDLVTPRTTSAGVWSRGHVSPLPAGSLMGIPTTSAAAIGVLTPDEAAAIDEEPAHHATVLETDTDVASYVAGRVGAPVVDRLVEPLLGGVYAGHASQLSLQATVPALWEAARSGESVVATARTVAARAQSAGPPSPVFAGLVGGVGRLPAAVAQAIVDRGGEVRTRVTVRELRRAPGTEGWQVVIGSRADEQVLAADAVVIAVPARPAGRLLATVAPGAADRLGSVEAASMALVTAVLPRGAGLVGERSSGFLVPPVDGRTIKAVTYSSAKWGWLGERAGADLVVRLSVGRQGEEALLQRPDDELAQLALAELALALKGPLPQPTDTQVVRWGGGLPQYAVGHVDLVAFVRTAVAAVPRLAICGAYLDGVGVPACIASGRRAAAELLADLPLLGADGGRTMAG
jgi:oxygen-dependent protoporphyrinogen oxidase